MRINISKDYKASADSDLLGYIGETNARTIEVEQPEVPGADCYRLRFAYPDGVVYDVPLADGVTAVDGSLLRKSGHVKCQWLATAADGDSYKLVAKSNVFVLRVEGSISDEIAPVPTYEQSVKALDKVLTSESTAAENADKAEQSANSAKAAENAVQAAKTELETATAAANIAKTNLETAITAANTTKSNLDSAKTAAETAISSLNTVIGNAETSKSHLSSVISQASDLDASLTEQNSQALVNISALSNENFNADEILTGVEDIKAYLGYVDEDIAGICVDYQNKAFSRLAGAYGKNSGEDFDVFPMFGGRKRCNVADDGTINAYYGDEGYTEDGSNGQVMVYQPKFYYKVVPLKVEAISTGIGHHLRKANYYVSSKPKTGFKLHPAFYDENGNPIDYILLSAYEGSMYDTSAAAYVNDDTDTDTAIETGDLLCSAAGKKPISGKYKNLNRTNLETLAGNRGTGWHGDLIKAESANQLLMIIELGTMNTQAAIENGVVSITDNSAYNCSSLTGSTAALGNATGAATETINEIGGVQTTYNTNGKRSVTYRGMENPWGNLWKHIQGINIWGDGTMCGGQPYICSDFAFENSKSNDNYVSAGFTISNASGYISAMGYSEEFDWLFLPSECTGASNLPVSDYAYITENLNGYRIARLGGIWNGGSDAGGFYWSATSSVDYCARSVGGRLVYVPTKK